MSNNTRKCAVCGVIFVPNGKEKTCPTCYEHASKMGQKGGNTTKARYGQDYYIKMGKKGGQKVKTMMAIARDALKIEAIEVTANGE